VHGQIEGPERLAALRRPPDHGEAAARDQSFDEVGGRRSQPHRIEAGQCEPFLSLFLLRAGPRPAAAAAIIASYFIVVRVALIGLAKIVQSGSGRDIFPRIALFGWKDLVNNLDGFRGCYGLHFSAAFA
jgi:hypothetical protein